MTPATPRVSVVMPVYNAARFVTDAVASILQQSLADLELLVVDDGSTDDTAETLAAIRDPRLTVLHQPNAGAAAARNRALAAASAGYVALMDADDRSYPRRLELQAAFLDAHPDVALVGSSYDVIDDDDRVLHTMPMLLGSEEIRRDAFTRNPFGNGTVMFRRAVLEEVGPYDGARWPAEDYDLFCRILRRHDARNLPDVLYAYRQHDAQSSTDRQAAQAERIRDHLWASAAPPRLTAHTLVRELRPYLAAPPGRRAQLVLAYADRHRALQRQAVRRRRSSERIVSLPALALVTSADAALRTARRVAVSRAPWSGRSR